MGDVVHDAVLVAIPGLLLIAGAATYWTQFSTTLVVGAASLAACAVLGYGLFHATPTEGSSG